MCEECKKIEAELDGATYEEGVERLTQETRDHLQREIVETYVNINKGEMSLLAHQDSKERVEATGDTYPVAGIVAGKVQAAFVERDKAFLKVLEDIQNEYFPEDHVEVEVFSMTKAEFDALMAEEEANN